MVALFPRKHSREFRHRISSMYVIFSVSTVIHMSFAVVLHVEIKWFSCTLVFLFFFFSVAGSVVQANQNTVGYFSIFVLFSRAAGGEVTMCGGRLETQHPHTSRCYLWPAC